MIKKPNLHNSWSFSFFQKKLLTKLANLAKNGFWKLIYLMNEIFGGFPFEENCMKLGGFNSGSLVFSYILVCQKIECPFFVLSAQFDRD